MKYSNGEMCRMSLDELQPLLLESSSAGKPGTQNGAAAEQDLRDVLAGLAVRLSPPIAEDACMRRHTRARSPLLQGMPRQRRFE